MNKTDKLTMAYKKAHALVKSLEEEDTDQLLKKADKHLVRSQALFQLFLVKRLALSIDEARKRVEELGGIDKVTKKIDKSLTTAQEQIEKLLREPLSDEAASDADDSIWAKIKGIGEETATRGLIKTIDKLAEELSEIFENFSNP